MSSTTPSGEMPIVFSRLQFHDQDKSGGLSPQELEKMDRDDVRAIFNYGTEEGGGSSSVITAPPVDYDHAVQVLRNLQPKTRSDVLRGFSSYGHELFANEFLKRLAAGNFNRLVADIARDYRTEDADGLKGYLLLKTLNPVLKEKVTAALKKKYPAYAALIQEWEQIKKVTPISGERVFFPPTHPDAASALREAMKDKSYSVYGFGECHIQLPPIPGVKIPLQRFATDIMPFLAKGQGVLVFGFEHIPSDIEDELQFYMETGRIVKNITPALDFMLKFFPDAPGIIAVLDSVRQLQGEGYAIEIHGVGGSFQDVGSWLQGTADEGKGIAEINQQSLALVEQSLAKGKKVALYTGALHNEVATDPRFAYMSYVDRLKNKDKFIEIDIVVPEYERSELKSIYQSMAPKSGVRFSQEGKATYRLIFNVTDQQNDYQDRHDFFNHDVP